LPEKQINGLEIVEPIFPDTYEIDPRISSVANPLGLPALIFFRSVFWSILAEYPLQSSSSMKFGFVVWLLVFRAYFARRAL
jgi:hypothetical protein